MTGDTEFVGRIETDYTAANLPGADGAMLDYVVKLTLSPADVEEGDVVKLRDAGFDDRAILDIAQITAYYAYVNRIADGLGVTLEAYWSEGRDDY